MTETLIRKRCITNSERRLLPALVLAVLAAGVATLCCAADLTADQVRLTGPLKELGLYTVKVHLHQEIEADLKVWVVPTAA